MKKKLLTIFLLFCFSLPTIYVLAIMLSGCIMTNAERSTALAASVFPLLPSQPTGQFIIELLLDTPEFFVMLSNSLYQVGFQLLGQLLAGAPAAWALSRLNFKGRSALLCIYIILMLIPFQVTMAPSYFVFSRLGIMDSALAVILPGAFSAFAVFIMVKGFDAVPKALLEAASLDGAGYFKSFLLIGLPIGAPGILAAMILGFLEAWNAIEQPLTFLQNKTLWPLALYLPQISAEAIGLAMAGSVMTLLPAALLFLLFQKYLELGIQAGGIKE